MNNSAKYSIITTVILAVLLLGMGVSLAETSKLRVAIVDFDRGSTNAKPEQITYRIRSGLVKSGKFTVIAPETVKEAMKELKIPQEGVLEKYDAIKLGEALQADLVLVGEVKSFDVSRSSSSSGVRVGFMRVGSVYSVSVTLDIFAELCDVNQKGCLFSEVFQGQSFRQSADVSYRYANLDIGDPDKDSMTKKVFDESINKIVNKIEEKAPRGKTTGEKAFLSGYILAVEDGCVIIDLGKSAMQQPGVTFEVIQTKEYKHPKTGQVYTDQETVGKIQVVEVRDKVSRARVTEGKIEDMAAGAMVREANYGEKNASSSSSSSSSTTGEKKE